MRIMNFVNSHVSVTWSPPDLLTTLGWSPELLAGPTAAALRASATGTSLAALGATLVDGWRVSETPGTSSYDPRAAETPIYRQANIGAFALVLGAQHWDTPEISGRWCVQPDDVVLNKIAPIRAALVTANARRHPVDGNSIIIRGLSRPAAAWVTTCLNHDSYAQLLLAESGVLKRVGLGALKSLKVAPPPPEVDSAAEQLREAIDSLTITGERLFEARSDTIRAAIAPELPATHLQTGQFFPVRSMTCSSWLPSRVALQAEHDALDDEHGWVTLDQLASFDDRRRIDDIDDAARPLRLGDVGDDLFIPAASTDTATSTAATRMLAKPLVPGEVLVSTLGNSFRTAYVDEQAPERVHPLDGWVRLRFKETPAAWALILTAPAIRSQAARLAIGSVQQFVPPDALRSLRLPCPPRELRDRWQRAVEQHHAQRRVQDRRWAEVMKQISSLFDAVHGIKSRRSNTQEAHR